MVSWYRGAGRTHHLRSLADYAVDVLRRRGQLEAGAQPGRWRLTGSDGLVQRPLGQVFTAAVGVAGNPVGDDWRADAFAAEHGHIWFAQSSNQLNAGNHLFAIGVSRARAVLGLFEVLSSGDLRQPRNPWQPDRWPYATAVRALASVPPAEATSVPNVQTPRATAYRVPDDEQRRALYAAMRGYEVHASSSPTPAGSGLAERARALRRARAFDPEAVPSACRNEHVVLGSDEIEDLQEKAQPGHHAILVALATALIRQGWTDVVEIPLAIDLWARRPSGDAVIFEAKTITVDNERRQCRGALAQLLEYRLEYGSADDALIIVVDRRLSERRADLLDRLGVAAALVDASGALVALNSSAEELVTGQP